MWKVGYGDTKGRVGDVEGKWEGEGEEEEEWKKKVLKDVEGKGMEGFGDVCGRFFNLSISA